MQPTAAGNFRDRVTVIRRGTGVKDEMGEIVPVDMPIGTFWASVRPLSSKELLQNAQDALEITHKIRMRWTPEIRHTDILLFRGRRLQIQDVTDVLEQRRELAITANEQEAK